MNNAMLSASTARPMRAARSVILSSVWRSIVDRSIVQESCHVKPRVQESCRLVCCGAPIGAVQHCEGKKRPAAQCWREPAETSLGQTTG